MRWLWREFRSAWRTLRASPGTVAGAVAALGLGVAAVTMLFAVIRPSLDVPFSDRTVWIFETRPELGWDLVPTSPEKIEDWRAEQTAFVDIAGYYPWHFNVVIDGRPWYVRGARVGARWPALAGFSPVIGRTFDENDLAEGADPVVLVSEILWRDRLGSAPDVIGSHLRVDGVDRTVIGVVPAEVGYGRDLHELWIPDARFLGVGSRFTRYISGVAALREGTTLDEARADMRRVQTNLTARYPEAYEGWGTTVVSAREYRLSHFRYFQFALFLLFAGAGLVLLIGCANIANLVLVRNASREAEFAVRSAFGATRASLVREHVFEGLILGVLSGIVGVWLAMSAIPLLPPLLPASLRWREHFLGVDFTTAVFGVALAILVGAWVGLLPGLQISRSDLATSLKRGARTVTIDPRGRRTRFVLAATQIAVAFAVLAGAALLVFHHEILAGAEPGIRTQGVVAFPLRRPQPPWAEVESLRTFHSALLESLADVPHVDGVATINFLPLEGTPWAASFTIDREGAAAPDEVLEAQYRVVSPGYFDLMGIDVLEGRGFGDGDDMASGCAVVANASARDRFWPGEDPIGATIRGLSQRASDSPCEVVGVVGDVAHFGLGSDPVPEMYYAFAQRPFGWMTVVLRTGRSADDIAPELRKRVAALDPDQSIGTPRALADIATDSLWMVRYGAAAVAALAAIAVILAAAGTYSALRVWTLRRTREIAIRIALGARPIQVEWMVVKQALALTAVAVCIGVPLAAAFEFATWYVPFFGRLAGAPPRIAIYGGALVAIFLLALLSCLPPARRAASTNPADALRYP